MATLIQFDAAEEIIAETEVDVSDYKTVLEAVHYFDARYKGNQEEIRNWIESGAYKMSCLSISGEDDEVDEFDTSTMYLEIV